MRWFWGVLSLLTPITIVMCAYKNDDITYLLFGIPCWLVILERFVTD